MNQWAMLYVNPLTVSGMNHIMKKMNYKWVINTAASSAVGKMLWNIWKANNI